ncbi:probable 2-oxoglutarate-dependent dioxygenase AOP1 [Nicotiana tomentosiformis]|uniref:Probable 2-oxoglutarate-dependent dioxygenase AOP1 isoform X1 n=1 Tax=Nicotiana tabacum TaxID=4097 RepID=A0A1S4D1K1_TOBAC|nr:probable 2-oxoglutarate-dependent dioxygenase AOP1 [Nicotiana tomentosiformis]XP_016507297.1 PREDICTED: probable 2-oxoglutarate-dependent dioxygenase AOP1 isoform X1 [Nicotiana tabacum]
MSQTLCKAPIIDLNKLEKSKRGSNSWLELCNGVRLALEDHGYFIALYDKVSSEVEKEIFDVMDELFDLPIETKKKNSSDFYFYRWVGQLEAAPLHESFGIVYPTHIQALQSFTTLMWPQGNQRFSETVTSYVKVAAELEQLVDKMVFESYGVAERHYESHIAATTYLLRPTKYAAPPPSNINNVGANIHTDKSFSTLLFQNQINGLQVESKSGDWIAVNVPPSAFVFMAGDAYEAWSNGRIYAPRHQVLLKEEKQRYTLALFTFNKGITDIPEELVDETHPLQYKPFDNFGLAWYYLSGANSMIHSTAKAYCGINTTASIA